jgi:TPR repeat protein
VQSNPAEARQWYTKAASQGHVEAQVNLGSLLYHGIGGARNLSKAFDWYTRAANQGNPQAQSAMGDFYLHGINVPQMYRLSKSPFRPRAAASPVASAWRAHMVKIFERAHSLRLSPPPSP